MVQQVDYDYASGGELKINNIINSVARKLHQLLEGSTPSPDFVASALFQYNLIATEIEKERNIQLTNKVYREHIFSDPDAVVGDDGNTYRCTRSHTVPNITTWANGTTYLNGAKVYPTTENGFYYQARITADPYTALTSGASGATEPTFPEYDNGEVVDNVITWRAMPDTKPVTGKNWKSYWYLDSDYTGAVYEVNHYYQATADFKLGADALYIAYAHLQRNGSFAYDCEQDNEEDFLLWKGGSEKGNPDRFFVDIISESERVVRFNRQSDSVGASGYVFKYACGLKSLKYINSASSFQFMTDVANYIDWRMTENMVFESNLPDEYRNDLMDRAKEVTSRWERNNRSHFKGRLTSCY